MYNSAVVGTSLQGEKNALAIQHTGLVVAGKAKLQSMKDKLFTADKGGKEIIIELGLTVIAVALIVFFRTEIKALVDTVMETATTNITSMFTF